MYDVLAVKVLQRQCCFSGIDSKAISAQSDVTIAAIIGVNDISTAIQTHMLTEMTTVNQFQAKVQIGIILKSRISVQSIRYHY